MTHVYYPVFLTLGSTWVCWPWLLYHVGMTLKDIVDFKGPTACQNHVPGKEMEEKERDTTSGTGKLDRRSHLLLLPPSSWAAVNTGLFLQVHVCVLLALHLSFWVHLEVLEVMQGALWVCKTAEWLRALPGRKAVLTFGYIPHPRRGKAFGGRGEREGSMGAPIWPDERYWADMLGQLQDNFRFFIYDKLKYLGVMASPRRQNIIRIKWTHIYVGV